MPVSTSRGNTSPGAILVAWALLAALAALAQPGRAAGLGIFQVGGKVPIAASSRPDAAAELVTYLHPGETYGIVQLVNNVWCELDVPMTGQVWVRARESDLKQPTGFEVFRVLKAEAVPQGSGGRLSVQIDGAGRVLPVSVCALTGEQDSGCVPLGTMEKPQAEIPLPATMAGDRYLRVLLTSARALSVRVPVTVGQPAPESGAPAAGQGAAQGAEKRPAPAGSAGAGPRVDWLLLVGVSLLLFVAGVAALWFLWLRPWLRERREALEHRQESADVAGEAPAGEPEPAPPEPSGKTISESEVRELIRASLEEEVPRIVRQTLEAETGRPRPSTSFGERPRAQTSYSGLGYTAYQPGGRYAAGRGYEDYSSTSLSRRVDSLEQDLGALRSQLSGLAGERDQLKRSLAESETRAGQAAQARDEYQKQLVFAAPGSAAALNELKEAMSEFANRWVSLQRLIDGFRPHSAAANWAARQVTDAYLASYSADAVYAQVKHIQELAERGMSAYPALVAAIGPGQTLADGEIRSRLCELFFRRCIKGSWDRVLRGLQKLYTLDKAVELGPEDSAELGRVATEARARMKDISAVLGRLDIVPLEIEYASPIPDALRPYVKFVEDLPAEVVYPAWKEGRSGVIPFVLEARTWAYRRRSGELWDKAQAEIIRSRAAAPLSGGYFGQNRGTGLGG
jgi:hypothetical protein